MTEESTEKGVDVDPGGRPPSAPAAAPETDASTSSTPSLSSTASKAGTKTKKKTVRCAWLCDSFSGSGGEEELHSHTHAHTLSWRCATSCACEPASTRVHMGGEGSPPHVVAFKKIKYIYIKCVLGFPSIHPPRGGKEKFVCQNWRRLCSIALCPSHFLHDAPCLVAHVKPVVLAPISPATSSIRRTPPLIPDTSPAPLPAPSRPSSFLLPLHPCFC